MPGAESCPLLASAGVPGPAGRPIKKDRRDARSTSATRYVPPGFAASGSFSRRKMKRADENRFERFAHAAVEAAFGRALLVERHQAIDFARGQRPPVCVAAEPRHDLPRARLLFARDRRAARKDALTARCLRDPGDPVRSLDRQVADMRQRRDARATGAAAGERPVVRPDQVLVRAIELAHERRGDAMLSGADHDRLGAHDGPPRPSAPPAGPGRTSSARRSPLIEMSMSSKRAFDPRPSRSRTYSASAGNTFDDHAAAGAERRTLTWSHGCCER